MRTIIGVVGSNRDARLRLMKELSNRLENEGYNVILVFRGRSGNDTDGPKCTLIVSTFDSSTFIRANFKLSIDDLKRLFPSRWCLMLVEEYRATPYIVAATSEDDVDELGPQSVAIAPLNDELIKTATSWKDKIVTVNRVAEIVREILLEDIMKLLMREECGECGFNSCRGLAEAIARGEETPLKCVKRRENVRLIVDGDLVKLNPFTSKMFVQVLTSLLSILRGVPRSFKKIVIEVDLD